MIFSFQDTTSIGQSHYPESRHVIRQAFQQKGIPECALETLLSSLSSNTIKQYNSSLKSWWNYCLSFKASVSEVIQFLQQELDQNTYKYGTFNNHRSALALILHENVGTDIRVRRFLREECQN